MKHGFIKAAAATPEIRVADCVFNAARIKESITDAAVRGADILVLPELCVTGYTCGDLFYQTTLLEGAKNALDDIRAYTVGKKESGVLVFVGLPLTLGGRIYNVAAALKNGEILGLVPKSYLPNYNEFYDKRQFAAGKDFQGTVVLNGTEITVSSKLIFVCRELPELKVAAEICEDLWVMSPPSAIHAQAGATVIVNLSASNETVGKAEYRRSLVTGQSGRLLCAYIYASAGDGESATDIVFGGHNIIAENGKLLAESPLFENGMIISETDVYMLYSERTKFANYDEKSDGYTVKYFSLKKHETQLTRLYPKHPFVPDDSGELNSRAELILGMQAHALKKKLGQRFKALIGISGGLDSTLALLAASRAMTLLGRSQKDVLGITMPCFGTSDRTYGNACALAKALGIDFESIDITASVTQHLNDIKNRHDIDAKDAAYENAQARERTQVLMDVSNAVGGIVVGTGDLSELALGWCTYNGDHMSMYAVNSSVPKTLVKYLVKYEAVRLGGKTGEILRAILDTPISPELLPLKDGEIEQKTEDVVGPYELQDFFLYYFIRFGFSPDKLLRLAEMTFKDVYDKAVIKKWLKVFVKRFFANQFKRNCIPDGVKIGSVSLSPRGDWRMPSDAEPHLWQNF
ncbi:MAG: NAD(+) synthase [Clostridiales bacterium]|jgi:NAD+ synthase (glutamine-hydrolysing)|nr:NAD(+) synthase [Clostridiales bacterium]